MRNQYFYINYIVCHLFNDMTYVVEFILLIERATDQRAIMKLIENAITKKKKKSLHQMYRFSIGTRLSSNVELYVLRDL